MSPEPQELTVVTELRESRVTPAKTDKQELQDKKESLDNQELLVTWENLVFLALRVLLGGMVIQAGLVWMGLKENRADLEKEVRSRVLYGIPQLFLSCIPCY